MDSQNLKVNMKALEIVGEFPGDHFVCSICGNFLFEIEQVSQEQVRLICENCGQCHLIVAGSEGKNRFLIKFCNENKNKLNIT
jgi:hypothetical protein